MALPEPGIKYEGHWWSSYEPHWPHPEPRAVPWKGQSAFLEALDRVESMLEPILYRGFSWCRVCRMLNGNAEFNLNGWRWPSGFRHYIEQHNVKPSDEFVQMIRERCIVLHTTTNMKTILIWDMCGQEPIQFVILDGDYSHLDGIFINHVDHDPALIDELYNLMYDKAGQYRQKLRRKFPIKTVRKPDTKVIIAGFLP